MIKQDTISTKIKHTQLPNLSLSKSYILFQSCSYHRLSSIKLEQPKKEEGKTTYLYIYFENKNKTHKTRENHKKNNHKTKKHNTTQNIKLTP